ncbi:MAG: N-formylglutamate amidohydrolase [Promethearchaeota archaeon]
MAFEKHIRCHKGDIPLIISVPHSGTKKPKVIPNRRKGIVGTDKNSKELALELIRSIEILYQSKSNIKKIPSYIISNVHRSKIDINRNESKAYDVISLLAKEIYQYYHHKIQELIYFNLTHFNRSLLIDVHGFETKDIPAGFRDVDIILGTNNLESLYSVPKTQRFWGKDLRGKIIKAFVKLGISIAPNHQRGREYALTGGYITQKYGASKIKNSQAIQIEFSDRVRLYNENLRKIITFTLANLLFVEFA